MHMFKTEPVGNVAKNGKKPRKKSKITPRHRKFVDFYIENGNASESYRKAGYNGNNANVSASQLLSNPNIQEYLAKRRKEIAEKSDFTAQMVLNEIAKLAFSNSEDFFEWGTQEIELSGITVKRGVAILKTPDQLTRDHKACIQSIKETQHGIELKLYSKQTALESLKKYFGIDDENEIRKALAIKKGDSPDGSNESDIASRIKKRMDKLKNVDK